MFTIFFDRRIVHKEFILAGQSIPHTTVTYYSECAKMWEEFSPKLAAASRQHTISRFLFHQGIFYEKQLDCLLSPTHPIHLTWPPVTFLLFRVKTVILEQLR
jgi:hypothetical protein